MLVLVFCFSQREPLLNFELPMLLLQEVLLLSVQLCSSLINADDKIGKIVLPNRGSETFISAIGHLDGRIYLHKSETITRAVGEPESLERVVEVETGSRTLMDLCIMASKLAYENELVVRNVVNLHWKVSPFTCMPCPPFQFTDS